jgi:hypothetical protein
VIVSLHVATGAAGGALAGSRRRALLLGPVLHLAGDLVPHWDVKSRTFELRSGVACLALVAAARGALDPATLCAATASAPDLEHVLPLPRPGGRKLFPSHRVHGWHRPGGLRTRTQLLAAGVLLGLVVSGPRRPAG